MIKQIQAIDTRAFQTVFDYPGHPSLQKMARIVSRTADGWLYILFLPLAIAVMKLGHVPQYLMLTLTGFAIERAVYFFLKNSFKRRRPPQAIQGVTAVILASDEFSLPSGHTSAAFFVVTLLSFGFSPAFLPLYFWAAAVGISRIILGVHFPTDVMLGALLGFSIAFIILS